MLNLEINFATGRFHATPWGHHVNEGAVEWPPSPWRLLRAFVAVWHLKLRDEFPDETILARLIDKLAQSPPLFELPPATSSHTRHYVPVNDGKKESRTKIFDTFIHIDRPLRLCWNIELSDADRTLLNHLCENVVYFGRGESVVEIRLVENVKNFELNARPLTDADSLSENAELVKVLCPLSAGEYQTWRERFENERKQEKEAKERKTGKRRKKSGDALLLPENLLKSLRADTGDLQKQGWPLPPGAHFVDYTRPRNCFASPHFNPIQSGKDPTVARFAVHSAVLPRITRAISLADRVHAALLSLFKALFKESSPPQVFTGRDANGDPLQGHQHCQIFCEANGDHDRITHITLFAKMKFRQKERRTIESIRKVWGHGGHDVHLVLLGFGNANTFPDCLPLGIGAIWESLTPFVATRHPKTRRNGRLKLDENGWHIGSPEHDLRRLLLEQGFPAPEKIEPLSKGLKKFVKINQRKIHPIQFQTFRRNGDGRRSIHSPVGFRITFPQTVSGPIAVGYGAHYGLGLFHPLDKTKSMEKITTKPSFRSFASSP